MRPISTCHVVITNIYKAPIYGADSVYMAMTTIDTGCFNDIQLRDFKLATMDSYRADWTKSLVSSSLQQSTMNLS